MASAPASHSTTRPESLVRGTILALVSALLGLLIFVVPTDDDLPTAIWVGTLIVVVLAALFCWGLWNLKRWGGIATVVLTALNVLTALPAFFESPGSAALVVIAIIVVTGIAALYFILQPDARAAWNRRA